LKHYTVETQLRDSLG